MDIEQHELASTGDTEATPVTVTNASNNLELIFFIKVVSGTLKLGKKSVNAAAHGWTSADTIPPMSCRNGELYVKQAAAGDTWVVTCSE